MNRDLVRKLLLYLVDQLQDLESPISTIRLVKLLYLIDLEYYKHHFKTLTGIDWVKHTYGPYFFALPDVLQSTEIDLQPVEVMTESGRGKTFRVDDEQDISGLVDRATEAMINRIVKKWADEDTRILLDYVYTTLPVKYGIKGRPLDFTYESDAIALKEAREQGGDFVTLDELFAEFGNPFDDTTDST